MPDSVDPAQVIAPIVGLLDSLLAAEKNGAADRAAAMLLGVDHQLARDAFEERASRLHRPLSEDLTRLVLQRVSRRVLGLWPRWLDVIDESALSHIDAREELKNLAEKLWSDAINPKDAPSEEAVDKAASSLSRLIEAIEDWDPSPLSNSVAASLDAASELVDYAPREKKLSTAVQLATAGIISPGILATSVLSSLASLLNRTVNYPAQLAEHIARWASWLVRNAAHQTTEDFLTAITQSVWLASPRRENLLMESASALKQVHPEQTSPLSVGELTELTNEHGAGAEAAVRVWLVTFFPNPQEAWSVVEPLMATPSQQLLKTVERYSSELSPSEKLEFLRPAIVEVLNTFPSEELLRHAQIDEVESTQMTALLIELYEQATKLEQRENVLRLWDRFHPLEDSVRKQLIERVYIPFLATGRRALDVGLKYLGLCVPPPYGTATALREALRRHPSYADKKKKNDDRLVQAGLLRRKGFLGRRLEDTPDDR